MSSELTRFNLSLIPKAAEALDSAVELGGHSKTDTINRAIRAYAHWLRAREAGGGIYVRESADAELFLVEFL
jgi:hypothetical protein